MTPVEIVTTLASLNQLAINVLQQASELNKAYTAARAEGRELTKEEIDVFRRRAVSELKKLEGE